jgi:hypothetical protein
MNHTRLTFTVATTAALLAGCHSTGGNPPSGVTPPAPTTTTGSSTSVTTPTYSPAPSPTATAAPPVVPPSAQQLPPQNGYVFIATKSGKTRCQISAAAVGCESDFTNAPTVEGEAAHGVRVTKQGKLSWVAGNLGAIPTVPIDYQTYSALGWTISATADGTRFTNEASGHGMFISTSEAKAF